MDHLVGFDTLSSTSTSTSSHPYGRLSRHDALICVSKRGRVSVLVPDKPAAEGLAGVAAHAAPAREDEKQAKETGGHEGAARHSGQMFSERGQREVKRGDTLVSHSVMSPSCLPLPPEPCPTCCSIWSNTAARAKYRCRYPRRGRAKKRDGTGRRRSGSHPSEERLPLCRRNDRF